MGLVHVDTPKVELSRQMQTRRLPCSLCRQTFEKLDQNKYFKCFKAANKWFKRFHKVLVCSSVLRFSNLQFFVQHGGRPSAFRQNSSECHGEIDSSFPMQPIRHSCSNHLVHWFVPCNFQYFSLNELFCVYFWTRPSVFLEILNLLMCRFSKKQPRISALCITGSQESPQAHWFVDISSSWRQY